MLSSAMYSKWPGAAHVLALGCLLFIVSTRCEAQNLVPNPSFEESDTCAVQLGFFPNGRPMHWFAALDTPDYFRGCVSYGSPNGVPVNTFGFQVAQNGESYSGMFSHLVDDYREMIGTELLEPLTIGQTYYGSFWVNAAYGGPQQTGSGCNNTGMLFTMEADLWLQGMPQLPARNYAHVYSQQVITDTVDWTLVSGSFIADSAYRFLVLGNHFSNANTTLQDLGPGVTSKAYVLVDEICLSADPVGCPLVTSVGEIGEDLVGLWPNPASDQLRIGWGRLPVNRLVIMDAMGRRLVEQETMGKKEVAIEINDWPNGVYHLLLEGEGTKHLNRFVVIH